MAKSTAPSGPKTTSRESSVLPDDLRRTDSPDTTPDSLPRPDQGVSATGCASEDGGVAQHPVHDEDLEDLEPQDYERDIDAATAQGDLVDIINRKK
jgi:hypothetical protein